MFRWDDLQILLAVSRAGSLSGAARTLGVDASTTSRRLRGFEEALGVTLFERTPDGLVITEVAQRLLPHAEQAESAATSVAALAAGSDLTPTGRVRVALADAFASFVVAPRLGRFLDAHPGLQVEILASADTVDLTRLEAEIAVRFVRPTQGDLVAQRVATTGAYRGWVHATYEAAHGPTRGMPEHWIGWSERYAHLPEAQLYERVVGIEPRLRCDDLTTMVQAWAHGAGALLLPSGIADLLGEARPTPVPDARAFELDIWVVTHRSLRAVPRVRAVRDWLVTLVGG